MAANDPSILRANGICARLRYGSEELKEHDAAVTNTDHDGETAGTPKKSQCGS